MTLYGNLFLNIISQNPYRVLGVTADVSKKDIIANVNKFKAFLKVGKHVNGAFDTIPGTNSVERTVETIESAEKAIELPIDQLRWSMFWFVNKTPIDKIALNHIQSGNIDKAIEIWSKVETVTSLINITVSELIRQNWAVATMHADKLFYDYAESICSLIDDTLNLNQAQLIHLFIDAIAEDNYSVLKAMYRAFPKCYSFDELVKDGECRFLSKPDGIDLTMGIHYPCLEIKKRGCTAYYRFLDGNELTEDQFNVKKEDLVFVDAPFDSFYKRQSIYNKEEVVIPSELWNKIIRETLAAPYIEKAKYEIASYRAIPKDKTEERYKFAKSMLLHYLPEIYGYLGENNSEYKILNNQIVEESLKCAIDYYNSAQEPDDIARDVKNFVRDITKTAIPESILRQRCKENYDILCEICSKLPPESVGYYHKLLKSLIEKYRTEAATIQNAYNFVNKCFPYLMSIKSVLGTSNAYYQKICTRVAEDALEDIIIDYNEKSESLHNKLEKATSSNRSNIIKLIQEMMKSAVITMYHLKQLGLEPDFRQNRFNSNYDIIIKQARNARALGGNSVLAILGGEVSEEDFNNDLKKYAPDLRDEKGYFSSIKNLQDCYDYRRIFPGGKFTVQVNSKVEEYEFSECSSLEDLHIFSIRYPSTKFDLHAKREEIIFKSCKTIEDYKSYIANYSTYKKEAEKRIDDLIFGMCRDRASFAHYLATYPNGGHRLEAQHKLDDIDYRACKTADDFENYLKSYPNGCHVVDVKKLLEEEKFWAICIKKDSWKLYKEYLSKFPYGKYKSEAKKKSKSPKEKFSEWRINHGLSFCLCLVLSIVLVIAYCKAGILGIGYCLVSAGLVGVFCSILAIVKKEYKSSTRVLLLIIGVLAVLLGVFLIPLGGYYNKINEANRYYNSLDDNSTVKDFRDVITNQYGKLNKTEQDELIRRYYSVSLDSCLATIGNYSFESYNGSVSGLGYLKDFVECCPDTIYKEYAQRRLQCLVDSLYYEADLKNTASSWENYQNSVSEDDYRDSDKRMYDVDPRWHNDQTAWKAALTLNKIASYKKYLSLFPNGRYAKYADEKIIDMSVTSIFAGNYSKFPEMEQVKFVGDSTCILITNNTSYSLTIMYSGVESKCLVLIPDASGTITLKNGSYRGIAYINKSDSKKCADAENLEGGMYLIQYDMDSFR